MHVAACTVYVELLLQYDLMREERIGHRGEAGAAADASRLFHRGRSL
jgi:hypothetical protein